MAQEIHAPVSAITSTAATVRELGRLFVPLAIAAAVTGGGLLGFFAVVTAVVL
ncbi:hypothetical protein [Natrinema marinum]|uniref:hypothetical protein n=1 Tax=Natrinema marinum TaxID=2961598 RepID=UPI0020C8EDCD|nr:hypothetical protein [Natrinema marinum]